MQQDGVTEKKEKEIINPLGKRDWKLWRPLMSLANTCSCIQFCVGPGTLKRDRADKVPSMLTWWLWIFASLPSFWMQVFTYKSLANNYLTFPSSLLIFISIGNVCVLGGVSKDFLPGWILQIYFMRREKCRLSPWTSKHLGPAACPISLDLFLSLAPSQRQGFRGKSLIVYSG